MKITCQNNCMKIEKENTDPKFYGVANGAGESRLLHHIKNYLNSIVQKNNGFIVAIKDNDDLFIPVKKFIKKRMAKDGHLMDDTQQYIRSEKPFIHNGVKTHVCFFNDHWAINGIEEDFNNGMAMLRMEFLPCK